MIVILMAGVSITVTITTMLVWFATPVSDSGYTEIRSVGHIVFFLAESVLLAPVENVTATNVGSTSFTVRWNVSLQFQQVGLHMVQ